MGGLNREGELISNFDSEGRGLLERGVNRAFTVMLDLDVFCSQELARHLIENILRAISHSSKPKSHRRTQQTVYIAASSIVFDLLL